MLMSDWQKPYPSIESLFEDLSIKENPTYWENGGWIETNTDTMFIETYGEDRDKGFMVHVWNSPNMRLQLINLLKDAVSGFICESYFNRNWT